MPRPIVVFLGPSLPLEEARSILDAWYLPPAQAGDVLAALRLRPRAIGLIDGLFHRVAGVWHKELLLAMDRGVAVVGGASMGALRAAELAPLGMVGVGKIFENYRRGEYRDDDEVALLHADESMGYRGLSEPLVNLRATAARAVSKGILRPSAARSLIASARELPYPRRRWDTLLKGRDWDRFRRFLEAGGGVDQKAVDARAVLRHLAGKRPGGAPRPAVPRTLFLRYLEQEMAALPIRADRPWLPAGERAARAAAGLPFFRMLRLLVMLLNRSAGRLRSSTEERRDADEMFRLTEPEAYGAAPPRVRRRLSATWAAIDRVVREGGMDATPEEFQRWVDAFRREQGLESRSKTLAWMRSRRLSRERMGERLASWYRLRYFLKNPPAGTPSPRVVLADVLRGLSL